jgi:Tol biopolymer transport system component
MRAHLHISRSKAARLLAGGISVLVLTTAAGVAAKEFGPWGPPVSAEALPGSSSQVNTSANDGCPIISPDGNYLYMASNRPGGQGGLDIWRAPRSGGGWGAPENLGPPVNTAADEFCPDPARGNRLFFVRRLSATNTDIFLTRTLPNGFTQPERLPTGDDAINSPWEEWSPSYFETEDGRQVLYFSSTRNGHPAQDIFYSVNFGPAQIASGGVNSSASDARPNVRHDGLEIVWDSTRTGSLGATDIWTASRSSVDEPWGTAVQLDNGINSAAGESRASLSWDGETLVFGSTRPGGEGSADIYVSTREKVTGQNR